MCIGPLNIVSADSIPLIVKKFDDMMVMLPVAVKAVSLGTVLFMGFNVSIALNASFCLVDVARIAGVGIVNRFQSFYFPIIGFFGVSIRQIIISFASVSGNSRSTVLICNMMVV